MGEGEIKVAQCKRRRIVCAAAAGRGEETGGNKLFKSENGLYVVGWS